jgi:two-component system nitrate/nitrite response regulator NarL
VRNFDGIRVLLAIGEAGLARSILRDLQGAGILDVVGSVDTAREALVAIREFGPDVLLLGQDLPDADAAVMLRQLRKRPDVRTVLVTSNASDDDLTEAASLGAVGVLEGRFSRELLLKCLRAIVEGEFWFSRGLTRALVDSIPDEPPAGGHLPGSDLLTPRETDVMQAAARGKSNREIARELRVSEHTVKQHLKQVFGKLEVSSRVELVLRVAREH